MGTVYGLVIGIISGLGVMSLLIHTSGRGNREFYNEYNNWDNQKRG